MAFSYVFQMHTARFYKTESSINTDLMLRSGLFVVVFSSECEEANILVETVWTLSVDNIN